MISSILLERLPGPPLGGGLEGLAHPACVVKQVLGPTLARA